MSAAGALGALVGVATTVELVRAARRTGARTRARALVPARPSRALVPRVARAWLESALRRAEVDRTPEEVLRVWAVAVAVVAVVAASFGALAVLVGLAAIVAGGPLYLRARARRVESASAAALPTLLDEVATELRSGGTVPTALERVGHGSGRLAPEMAELCSRTALGLDLGDALRGWVAAHPRDGATEIAGALAVASTTGGRAAVALGGLATSLRERRAVADDVHALSAQARVSALVVGAAPVAYLAFASVADPGSVRLLVGTGLGRFCLGAGLALDALAAWWMRRILRSAP